MSSSTQVTNNATLSRLIATARANNAKPRLRVLRLQNRVAAALPAMSLVWPSRRCPAIKAGGMKGFPYVPWYHGDFLRSTAGWSLIEQGIYWKLLCTQWEIGALPVDHVRLAAIVGIKPAALARAWPVVGAKFHNTPGGLVNERMEAHRTRYLEFRAKQSEGGKKAMEKRWGARGNVIKLRTGKDDDQ